MIENVNVNTTSQVPTNSTVQKTEEPKKEGLTKNQKIIMGTTAAAGLTAVTIGGILYTRGKNLSKQIDNLAQGIKQKYENLSFDEKYKEIFDIEKVSQHINEALTLPKKKDRLAKLTEIQQISDRGLATSLKMGSDVETLPKPIQEAIANKDHITASKLYCEYCDTRFTKSKTTGETVQQTIENIFGKDSIVTPHTYKDDVDLVVMSNNRGDIGFHINIVNSSNDIPHSLNHKASQGLTQGCCAHGYTSTKLTDGLPVINSGIAEGRTFVTISYGRSHNGPPYGLTLYGKKGSTEFTRAQQDLMNLDLSKLTDEEIGLLSKLPRDGENTNYDAVLSLIESLVEKTKSVF